MRVTLRDPVYNLFTGPTSPVYTARPLLRGRSSIAVEVILKESVMRRAIVAGLTMVLAIGGPALKAYAQDPSARCVSVTNEQMTIASAQGRGLYIENFSAPETVAFLKAFNATPPNSNFIATKMFAAVGGDRAYVFFESDKDLCTPPSPLSRESYDAFVGQAQGDGA